MRRDLDLVRDILLALEDLPVHFNKGMNLKAGEGPLALDGWSPEEIAYHIRIMTQGDLISNGGVGPDGLTIQMYSGFRWAGHEFLDDVRDSKTWKTTKSAAKSVGSGSVGFMWEVAKAIGKHEVGKLLHIPLD